VDSWYFPSPHLRKAIILMSSLAVSCALRHIALEIKWQERQTIGLFGYQSEELLLVEVNENENTNYQNLWDTEKAVLRRKFIAMRAYIKRTERSQINDLMLHLKLLEKQEQANPKTSRRREIIKMRAKMNEIETKKTIQRINETKT
jgi:hypothetical protein